MTRSRAISSRIHVIPLEQLTKNAIIGMEKLSESLGKIRAQCKED